jgi:uncharacterized membrane protein (TIGR02234 family)
VSSADRGRERTTALGLIVLAGGLALLASIPVWVTATVRDAGLPVVTSQVNGRAVAPLVAGAGLLALAGGVAALIAGVWTRRIIGLLLALIGAAAWWSVVGVLRDPAAAVQGSLGDAVGLTRVTVATASITIWPTVAMLACTLIVVAGLWTLIRAGGWSKGGSRFDRRAPQPSPESNDTAVVSPEDADGDASLNPDRVEAARLWDALDRGEDPTV